jgi:hypothetical protein
VISEHPEGGTAAIYISSRIPFAGRYWRFNAIREQREALIDAPIYVTDPPLNAAPGSSLLCATASPECAQMAASPQWRVSFVATEPDQAPSFHVLKRQPDR